MAVAIMSEIPSPEEGGESGSGGRDRDRGPVDDPLRVPREIRRHRNEVYLAVTEGHGSRDSGYDIAAMAEGMDARNPAQWIAQGLSYRVGGLILGWAADKQGAVEMGDRALRSFQKAWEGADDRGKQAIRNLEQAVLYGQLQHPDVKRWVEPWVDQHPQSAIGEARQRVPEPGENARIPPVQIARVANASKRESDLAAASFDRAKADLRATPRVDDLDRHLNLVSRALLHEAMARHLCAMDTDGGYVMAVDQLGHALRHAREAGQDGLQARIRLRLSDSWSYLEEPDATDSLARRFYDQGLELHRRVTGEAA
jgi:hypothetical protein